MNQQALIAAISVAVAAALKAGNKPAAKQHKPQSSYKPANKFEFKSHGLQGLSARQLDNDVKVAKAFAKQGITVVPRVDALTYKGWLGKGMRVIPGQHGTWVKGVGTLFHSGQVAVDVQPSKAEMTQEVQAMQQSAA